MASKETLILLDELREIQENVESLRDEELEKLSDRTDIPFGDLLEMYINGG